MQYAPSANGDQHRMRSCPKAANMASSVDGRLATQTAIGEARAWRREALHD